MTVSGSYQSQIPGSFEGWFFRKLPNPKTSGPQDMSDWQASGSRDLSGVRGPDWKCDGLDQSCKSGWGMTESDSQRESSLRGLRHGVSSCDVTERVSAYVSPAVDPDKPLSPNPQTAESCGWRGCLGTEMTTWSQGTNTGRDQANPEIDGQLRLGLERLCT